MRYVVKATAVAHPEGEMRGWVAVRFERLGRVELLTVFVADDGSTRKCDGCKAAGGCRNGKLADAALALVRSGWLPGFATADLQAAPVTA